MKKYIYNKKTLKNTDFLYPKFYVKDLLNFAYIERKSIYNFLKKACKKINYGDGGKVKKFMDFGCGEQPYRKLFEVDEYIGIDVKKSGHNNLYKKANIYYDGITIPFDDNYFDAALATQCFEHIYNINHIVSEINRVLKPNGTLIITLPLAWEEHEMPYDFFRFTSYGIKNILIENGFKNISIKKLNSYKNAIRQIEISYYFYKQNNSKKLKDKIIKLRIKLMFITIWNNLMFEISKGRTSNEPFSTCIGIICQKK